MRVSLWLYLLVCVGLLIGNVKVYRAVLAPPVLKVSMLEVGPSAGGGSAVLVQSPGGHTILIDTGPDASILRALGTALPVWQRNIDTVILTSTKSSLVGGLPEVQSRYRIGTLMQIGDHATPYGTSLALDGSEIKIIAPGVLTVFYGFTSLNISSSTPKGIYISDGKTITKTK